MDTRVIPLSDIDASDVAKWHDLADNALEPNLCLEPDTLLSIVSHNLAGPELRLVVSERDDRFEACVGVQQRQWRTRASRRVVTSRPDAHPTPLLPRLGVPLVREGGEMCIRDRYYRFRPTTERIRLTESCTRLLLTKEYLLSLIHI